MLRRDIDQELVMYDVEEAGPINALIIMIITDTLGKCTINQLACTFYLVRFTKVLSKVLQEDERELFLSSIPEWELGNLDAVLSPYIIQKYDIRFMRGLRELYAKNLIQIQREDILLSPKIRLTYENKNISQIRDKANFAGQVINRYDHSQLIKQLYAIVGEEQWEHLYSSTV